MSQHTSVSSGIFVKALEIAVVELRSMVMSAEEAGLQIEVDRSNSLDSMMIEFSSRDRSGVRVEMGVEQESDNIWTTFFHFSYIHQWIVRLQVDCQLIDGDISIKRLLYRSPNERVRDYLRSRFGILHEANSVLMNTGREFQALLIENADTFYQLFRETIEIYKEQPDELLSILR
jgi:hypothetical protein